MKSINTSNAVLKANEKKALEELKKGIRKICPEAEIILFGSRARGGGNAESDIDVLILIDRDLEMSIKDTVTEIAYAIELEHDVVFGKIIETKSLWNSPLSRVTPLHRNIDSDGLLV